MTLTEEIQNYQQIVLEYSGRVYFEGILCVLDQPSEVSPGGARGHKVIITTQAAEQAINTLVGAPVNYKEGWTYHDKNSTIGLITQATIEGNLLKVMGYLMTTKHPDIIEKIKNVTEPIGMSYEIDAAHVEDIRAPQWKITKISSFTGAAVLLQNKAAYRTSTFRLFEQP